MMSKFVIRYSPDHCEIQDRYYWDKIKRKDLCSIVEAYDEYKINIAIRGLPYLDKYGDFPYNNSFWGEVGADNCGEAITIFLERLHEKKPKEDN